jgi:hypothetical protein
LQQGVALEQGSNGFGAQASPQVPLVAPSVMLQVIPGQQSDALVHVPPAGTQAFTHVPVVTVSQVAEQHWAFDVQAVPFGTHEAHWLPTQILLQQVAPLAQVAPSGSHCVVSTEQW